MFRLIRLAFLLCLVFCVVVVAYLWASRVPTMERALSKQLGCKVEIDEVELGWKSLTLTNLKIQNPNRSPIPYALCAERLTIEAPLKALWSKERHIKRLLITKPVMEIELFNLSGSDNNWAQILAHMPQSRRSYLQIDRVVVNELQFRAVRGNGKALPLVTLPYIELSNLGAHNPLTPPQVSRIVLETMLSSVTNRTHLSGVLDNVAKMPPRLLEGVTSSLTQEEGRGLLRESFQTIKRKTQEATEFLQSLFS